MRGIRQTQMEFKTNEMALNAKEEKQKNFETKYVAKVPAYLQRFRREEEEERQRTLVEIEMNKRPMGTRVVTANEKSRMIDELNGRKAFCEEGIKNMSVTLYTNRAQNQYNGYVDSLNQIDEALTVFERPRVYVLP